MRCTLGLVLSLVLAYVGIQGLYAVTTVYITKNTPGISQRAAQADAWKVVVKYHAHVYVVAGLTALAVCALPSLFAKHSGFDEEAEWNRIAAAEQKKYSGGRA